jgi:aryl-alcohol dehydrogenase-like predicted oxidoreductase
MGDVTRMNERETRTIGRVPVSVAGLGCNNFGRRIDEERSLEVVLAALDAGVTTFDTAESYGDGRSEVFLGRALGARRDDAVIVTKFSYGVAERATVEGVARACDESLRRLSTDRIDVYLLHTPDEHTPISETLDGMSRLVEQGKVREIGCSNFSAEQLDEAAAAAADRGLRGFVTVQNEYSLLEREPERGVIEACRRHGISLMPYFPLASGILTGKYRRGQPAPEGSRLARPGMEEYLSDERLGKAEQLEEFARAHGHTLLELALSWLAGRPTVSTVIAGATTPEQVWANAAATTAWKLTDDELAEVDRIAGVG